MAKFFTIIACIAFMVMAFLNPSDFIVNAKNGMSLFAFNVLPILFPFFFVTGLLVELDLFNHKNLRRPGIVILSFLAGSPTSARMISQLYTRGQITRQTAMQTATYTSTASPIFIIATIGIALYGDVRLGALIFLSHVAGAIFNGITWSNTPSFASQMPPLSKRGELGTQEIPLSCSSIPDAIAKSLHSSIQNILAVGGLIVIFFIASAALPLPIAAILEMTTGVFRAKSAIDGIWRVIIACAIVSFGGLCVAMQNFVFFRTFQMPAWYYFGYKITHTIFAVVILVILLILF